MAVNIKAKDKGAHHSCGLHLSGSGTLSKCPVFSEPFFLYKKVLKMPPSRPPGWLSWTSSRFSMLGS